MRKRVSQGKLRAEIFCCCRFYLDFWLSFKDWELNIEMTMTQKAVLHVLDRTDDKNFRKSENVLAKVSLST